MISQAFFAKFNFAINAVSYEIQQLLIIFVEIVGELVDENYVTAVEKSPQTRDYLWTCVS